MATVAVSFIFRPMTVFIRCYVAPILSGRTQATRTPSRALPVAGAPDTPLATPLAPTLTPNPPPNPNPNLNLNTEPDPNPNLNPLTPTPTLTRHRGQERGGGGGGGEVTSRGGRTRGAARPQGNP